MHDLQEETIAYQDKGPGEILPAFGLNKLLISCAYSSAESLAWATVQLVSPTLNLAKRRTVMFSPSLPTLVAIMSLMAFFARASAGNR